MAAGILWIIFILILWGDLSEPGAREKCYALGNIPFLAGSIIPIMLLQFLTTIHISLPTVQMTTAFSIASFFLFLAVPALMYSPETLSEKKIELQRLRNYTEQARKIKEKLARGNQ